MGEAGVAQIGFEAEPSERMKVKLSISRDEGFATGVVGRAGVADVLAVESVSNLMQR
jgi:hypothetical protein